jgi:outer membrane receptor protein involved in Fe transport
VLGTSDDGGPITVFNQDPATFGQDQFVLTNPPGIDSDYKGIELQLTKRLSDRWQMIAGLTFGRANGFAKGTAAGTGGADNGGTGTLFDSPNSLINADGRSFWDRPVIFKLSGTYQAPYDIILAGFFRAQSGQPFPRTLFIDPPLNQGNVTIYAEPIGSRRLPSVYTVDLRVEKRIPISHGALGLSLDVFNIFNANTLLEADNLSGPTYLRPRTILAPRVARLGIRYDF